METLKPEDKLAAELDKIIKAAQVVLSEYRAAKSKRPRRREVVLIDPRSKKAVK